MNSIPISSRRALTVLLAVCMIIAATTGHAETEVLEQTKLELAVSASDNVNPDEKLRPQPIEIRIYELKNSQAFDTADYFSLHHKDKEILSSDLIKKDTFILRPGESRKISRKSDSETRAIGILAGYQNLGKTVWRVTHKLKDAPAASWLRFILPANKASLEIRADEYGLRVIEAK